MGKLTVAVVLSLWITPISVLVNRIVPDPYMDETFHVPQAQQYCNGNLTSWDPMITTPPGLYYISLANVACLFPSMLFSKSALTFSEACSVVTLRATNGVLAVLCSILVYEILIHLRPGLDKRKATIYAVVLALYPLHWFFTFLYYTDVASLTAVLAMHLAGLKKRYWLSALLGIFAIFIRQTNIVWMLFVACSGIIDITLSHQNGNIEEVQEIEPSVKKNGPLKTNISVISGTNLRKRKSIRSTDARNNLLGASILPKNPVSGLLDEVRVMFLAMWLMKWELLVFFVPYIIVLMAFAAFVYWNGSVVLGAKDAHTVSPHFAQIMYFGFFFALLTAPLHFSLKQVTHLFQLLWKRRPLSFFLVSVALISGFISVHFFSIAHPYLLADNRHYPFYIWRKVVNSHWSIKYLLVPLYVYSWFSIFTILGKVQKKIWVLTFFLATAAVLVPAPLIEFRYYTTPFYFLILHSHKNDYQSWLLVGILYIALNFFTMTMFLFRPFHWTHEPGIQRFIW